MQIVELEVAPTASNRFLLGTPGLVADDWWQCADCAGWFPAEKRRKQNNGKADSLCDDCGGEARRAEARRKNLYRNYGLTIEDYDALLAAQGGTCAISTCNMAVAGMGRRLAVDHDHSCCPGERSCGKCIRGLLCASHNIGLGCFGDDPEALEAAAAYLRGSGSRGSLMTSRRNPPAEAA